MDRCIYAIYYGEYSDWDVVGYTTTWEEAKTICEKHNDTIQGDYEWRYIELQRINDNMKPSTIYGYKNAFVLKGKEWEITDDSWENSYSKFGVVCKSPCLKWTNCKHDCVDVCFESKEQLTPAQCGKVARDKLMQFLYEHEEEIGGPGSDYERCRREEYKKKMAELEKKQEKRIAEDICEIKKIVQPIINEVQARGWQTKISSPSWVAQVWVTFEYDGHKTIRRAGLECKDIDPKSVVDNIAAFWGV